MKKFLFIFTCSIFFVSSAISAPKKQPLPRFATIKASEANSRKGPGVQYPVVFVYNYKWLPVEIISEYEQWKLIRDIHGDEGWIHSSILSSKRAVIIKGKTPELLYKNKNLSSRTVAKLMPDLVCLLNKCVKSWCKIKCDGYEGWIGREALFGVYDHEEW